MSPLLPALSAHAIIQLKIMVDNLSKRPLNGTLLTTPLCNGNNKQHSKIDKRANLKKKK